MNTLLYYIKRGLMALAVLLPFTSCNNFIYDDEGDCSVHYRLKLRYDMNLVFADTIHKVTSVKLYAFDAEDRLVWQTTEQGEALASCNHTLTLPLSPGKYRLVASLPVIDDALLVKGEHYRHMDDQEYLDRMDEFNMTLFLDEDKRWISTVIEVLSWRVVVNNTSLGN